LSKLSFNLTKKKLLLLGFLFAILLVIPLTVYLVQQQQQTQSQAAPSTTLAFSPESATAQVGEDVNLGIVVNPGSNHVTFIKLVLKFDPTKLTASESSFTVDPASNLKIMQGPVVTNDTLSVALSIGTTTTNVIKTTTKIGSVKFNVIGASELPTEVSFDPATEISSQDPSVQDIYENVFLSANSAPASITIQGEGEEETEEDLEETDAGIDLSPTPTTTTSGGLEEQDGANQSPVCSALGLDVSASGVAPYTITFTASGTDTDGTISKVAFNFGDGTIEEVTTGGGIGTDTVDISMSHTYETPNDYTASVIITDDQDGTSDSVACTSTISITGNNNATTTTTDGTTEASASATPLPATGPTPAVVSVGVLGGILLLIGALLFFAL
jgi:hypothetical protein